MLMSRHLFRDKRGQSLVELALVLPLVILILFGIIEFGRIFHSYLLITHASREGARVGIVGATNEEITQRVKDAAPLANADTITVTVQPNTKAARTSGVALTVKVDYPVALVTPILADILPNSINLKAQTVMRMEGVSS